MPGQQMERRATSINVTIANGAALSNAFHMGLYSMGIVHMPAAWTAADVGFQISQSEAGTYLPLYDEDAALVEISSAAVDKAFAIPPEVAAARWVKLWSQSGGSGVNQGAARTLLVDLKA